MEYPDVLVVNVRQHHIDKGQRGQSRACPIALALNEQYPETDWVVYYDTTYDNSKPYTPAYRPSRAGAEFAESFDYRQPVVPATFKFKRKK